MPLNFLQTELLRAIASLRDEGFRTSRRVQASNIRALNDGQSVTYDVVTERGKQAAANLKLASRPRRLDRSLSGAGC